MVIYMGVSILYHLYRMQLLELELTTPDAYPSIGENATRSWYPELS